MNEFSDRMKAAKAAKAAQAGAAVRKATHKPAPTEAQKEAKVVASRRKANDKVAAKIKLKAAPKVSSAKAEKAAVAFQENAALTKFAGSANERAAKPAPVAQTIEPSPYGPPTIARSYKREFRGIGATQRGNMLQVTVTFTPEQFAVLRERAEMYGASLSETIRRCVAAGPLSTGRNP